MVKNVKSIRQKQLSTGTSLASCCSFYLFFFILFDGEMTCKSLSHMASVFLRYKTNLRNFLLIKVDFIFKESHGCLIVLLMLICGYFYLVLKISEIPFSRLKIDMKY